MCALLVLFKQESRIKNQQRAKMGRKMDALLRRGFRTSKFKALAKLALCRLSILKNQRQVRSSNARSDVVQLLNLGHQDRALLRVEHVIKEQNMVDVFAMMEDFIHQLTERVLLLQNDKECPDELQEAISSLIFAATRCGEFPELQHIRGTFASRFGKEFAARAAELRNNCKVNPKMIQKLSTRQPSMENKLKMLKEIASECGIALNLKEDEEDASASRKVQKSETSSDESVKPYKPEAVDEINNMRQRMGWDEGLYESIKAKKFGGIAAAAQEAFEAAAYAAVAAKAAVELSRADTQDSYSDDHSGSNHQQLIIYEATPEVHINEYAASEEIKNSNTELSFNEINPNDNLSTEPEDQESENKPEIERTLSVSSSNSDRDTQIETTIANLICQSETCSEDNVEAEHGIESEVTEDKPENIPQQEHDDLKTSGEHDSSINETEHNETNTVSVSEEDVSDENSNELPCRSPERIQLNLKPQVDPMMHHMERKSKFESTKSCSDFEQKQRSQHSSIDRKLLSVRTIPVLRGH